jgi:hypothetical protein
MLSRENKRETLFLTGNLEENERQMTKREMKREMDV